MVVICFYALCSYRFVYSYLPSELYIYALFILLAIILNTREQITINIDKYTLFFILLLLTFTIDFWYSGRIENITYSIFICLLFSWCISSDETENIQYFSLPFLVITLVLSITFILFGHNFMNSSNASDGLVRMGWTDPNYFSCVVGMGTLLTVMQLLRKKESFIYTLFLLVTFILSMITIVLSASRGAILAISLSSVIFIFISKIKLSHKLIVIAFLCGIIVFMYTNQYFDLLIDRIKNDDGTGSGRTEIWLTKIDAFTSEKNPLKLLFGFGYQGGYNLGYRWPQGFHNDFLAFLVNYGIAGLSLFITALIIPVKRATSGARPTIIALVLYLVLCSMTLEPFSAGRLTYFGFYFYILVVVKYYESPVNQETNELK